jgi:hypothetical protein
VNLKEFGTINEDEAKAHQALVGRGWERERSHGGVAVYTHPKKPQHSIALSLGALPSNSRYIHTRWDDERAKAHPGNEPYVRKFGKLGGLSKYLDKL